jgi:hypothetical protein
MQTLTFSDMVSIAKDIVEFYVYFWYLLVSYLILATFGTRLRVRGNVKVLTFTSISVWLMSFFVDAIIRLYGSYMTAIEFSDGNFDFSLISYSLEESMLFSKLDVIPIFFATMVIALLHKYRVKRLVIASTAFFVASISQVMLQLIFYFMTGY